MSSVFEDTRNVTSSCSPAGGAGGGRRSLLSDAAAGLHDAVLQSLRRSSPTRETQRPPGLRPRLVRAHRGEGHRRNAAALGSPECRHTGKASSGSQVADSVSVVRAKMQSAGLCWRGQELLHQFPWACDLREFATQFDHLRDASPAPPSSDAPPFVSPLAE